MKLRVATPADGAAIFKIYSYYIENDTATFEITQLSPEIMSQRIQETLRDYPFLVWEEGGTIIGYSYAHRVGVREGFDYSAELSVYLSPKYQGGGIGRVLYETLMELLTLQGVCNVYATITHENRGSIQFHERLGFTQVGQITRAGYKLGRWLDVCWLWKPLIACETPVKVIPFTEIDPPTIDGIIKKRG